ncbi:MAG: orotidine-5'-phosphate decarboxylase, partial [Gemmataceae bacterium]|nr:orotidine-5'-phosphate decarboxylase [Gemmataceae bacterium]
MTNFADRLADAVRRKGNPLCVGIDPRWESLPKSIREHFTAESTSSIAAAFEDFSMRVLDLVAP